MKILALRVANVRRFSPGGQAIENIGGGFNVLAAENEFGKSTLFDCLKLVLFTKHGAKSDAVKSFQPYQSQTGPYIELDLEVDGEGYRIAKRYLRRAMAEVCDLGSGRMVAQGDDAEDWIRRRLAFDDSGKGPFGLLWVSQGDSLKPLFDKTDKHGRAKFLSDLIDEEIQAVAGGSGFADVVAAATADLARLVTPGRGKRTGDYERVTATVERLTGEVEALRAHLKDTEAVRQEFESLTERLEAPETAAKLALLKARVEDAGAALQSASRSRQRQDELKEQLRLAEEHAAAQQLALQAFVERQEAITAWRQDFGTGQAELLELAGRHDEAKASADGLAERVVQDEEKIARLSQALRAAAASAAVEQARETAERLKADLERLAALGARQKEIEGELAALTITAEAVETLDEAERAQRALVIRHEAAMGEIEVAYDTGQTGKVRAEGRAIGDGERVRVDGRLDLTIDGIGRISVVAGKGSGDVDFASALEEGARALKEAQRRAGCDDASAARALFGRRLKLEEEAARIGDEMMRLAPDGVDATRRRYEEIRQALGGASPAGAVSGGAGAAEALGAEVVELEQSLKALKQQLAAAEALRSNLAEKRLRREAALSAVKDKLDAADAEIGPENERARRREALEKKATAALARQADIAQVLKKECESALDVEAAKANRDSARTELDGFENRISEARIRCSRLEGQLERDNASGAGERLAEVEDALAAAGAKLAAYEAEERGLKLLINELGRAELEVKDALQRPVLEELVPLLQHVFPEAEIQLDDGFAPRGLQRGQALEGLEQLSSGTQEQVAVLTRLAFARLFARRGIRLPVVLDDALVFSDDHRLAAMLAVLTEAAKDMQLIFLTCRLNAFADITAHALSVNDWQPPAER